MTGVWFFGVWIRVVRIRRRRRVQRIAGATWNQIMRRTRLPGTFDDVITIAGVGRAWDKIARAVKRYMKHTDIKTVIIRPQEMIDYLLLD